MSESVWIVQDIIEGAAKNIGVFTSAEGADEAVTKYIAKLVKEYLSNEIKDDAEVIAAWKKVSTGSLKSKLDFYNKVAWFGFDGELTVQRTTLKD